MNFLHPSFLWALSGLLIPLAIHFWSKRKVPVIKIGSIQFLKNPDTRQTSSIQLNEWWLLALRLLAILLLVLIQAAPQIKVPGEQSPVTYIIEPSLLDNENLRTVLDTLPEGSVRLLEPGFPEWKETKTISQVHEAPPNYWQLARKMATLHTDSVVVFTRALSAGLKGKRPQVSLPVQWVVINDDTPWKNPVGAWKTGNEIDLIRAESDELGLEFAREVFPLNNDRINLNPNGDSILIDTDGTSVLLPLQSAPPISVHICYSERLEDEKEYIVAAFRAVSRFMDRPVDVQVGKDTDMFDSLSVGYLVWLSDMPVPDVGGRILVYQPDELDHALIIPGPTEKIFHLTKSLDPDNITEGHLTGHLIQFLNFHAGSEKAILHADHRSVSQEEISTAGTGKVPVKEYATRLDISKWFWLLLVVTLVLERILAKSRKQ